MYVYNLKDVIGLQFGLKRFNWVNKKFKTKLNYFKISLLHLTKKYKRKNSKDVYSKKNHTIYFAGNLLGLKRGPLDLFVTNQCRMIKIKGDAKPIVQHIRINYLDARVSVFYFLKDSNLLGAKNTLAPHLFLFMLSNPQVSLLPSVLHGTSLSPLAQKISLYELTQTLSLSRFFIFNPR